MRASSLSVALFTGYAFFHGLHEGHSSGVLLFLAGFSSINLFLGLYRRDI